MYQEYLQSSAYSAFSINLASRKPTSHLNPSRSVPVKEKKLTLIFFFFHNSLWYLKRFYEGLKDLHKTYWGTTKNGENKNWTCNLKFKCKGWKGLRSSLKNIARYARLGTRYLQKTLQARETAETFNSG